jgi:hypothetical protein
MDGTGRQEKPKVLLLNPAPIKPLSVNLSLWPTLQVSSHVMFPVRIRRMTGKLHKNNIPETKINKINKNKNKIIFKS